MLPARFAPFVQGAPVCVMVRAVLEFTLAADAVDEVFKRLAKVQYLRELLFSSLVGLMCQVVFGIRRSLCDAYHQSLEKTGVSLTSVYNKLQGVEDDVSAELLRCSARRIKAVVQKTGPLHRPLLGKYCTRVLDGNHLASTEHRLAELRLTRRGPLPGQALVVYEPDWGLITDVFLCQDAHAQERALIVQVLPRVGKGELWIADRNFCTTRFIFGLTGHGAFFAIRQHESTLVYRPLGKRRSCGRADNGRLYEQQLELQDKLSGQMLIVRRVTLLRDKPSSKGEREIHVLTNLPEKDASTLVVMQTLYRNRWTIEKAFGELERELKSEINTLGYPKAALFAFCLALCAYNGLQAIKSSMGAVHGGQTVEENVSGYYLGTEIASTYAGMMLAIPPRHWKVFAKMNSAPFAQALKNLAKSADLKRYPRHPRGPKKPRPPQTSGKKHHHLSTARLLALRKVIKSP